MFECVPDHQWSDSFPQKRFLDSRAPAVFVSRWQRRDNRTGDESWKTNVDCSSIGNQSEICSRSSPSESLTRWLLLWRLTIGEFGWGWLFVASKFKWFDGWSSPSAWLLFWSSMSIVEPSSSTLSIPPVVSWTSRTDHSLSSASDSLGHYLFQ